MKMRMLIQHHSRKIIFEFSGNGMIKNIDLAYRRLLGVLSIFATLWMAGCGFPAMSIDLVRPDSGWVTNELARCRYELNPKIKCINFNERAYREMSDISDLNEGVARLTAHDFECEIKSESTVLCLHRSVWQFSTSAGFPRSITAIYLKVLIVTLMLSKQSPIGPIDINVSYEVMPSRRRID